MSTASERGWGYPGAPGSGAETAYRRVYIKTVEVAGIKLAVRREVAHLFVGFINDLLATGYRLDVNADDWGFANRDIRGRPGVKSNHAWGLAVDLNATANPMTSDGRVHSDLPPETAGLARRWGLAWGANYSGARKDPMHFEFIGTPADVKKYPLIKPAPTPTPPKEKDVTYRYAYDGKIWTTNLVHRQHWDHGGPGFTIMENNTKDLGVVPADFHDSLKDAG